MELDIRACRSTRNYSTAIYISRTLWFLASVFLRLIPTCCYELRNIVLRIFGARIGPHVRIDRTARIFMPWNLSIGQFSCIGPETLIYNLGLISIGKRTTVSHKVQICDSTHDYTNPTMPLIRSFVKIGNDSWICTQALILPSVTIGEGSIIAAGSVVCRDVPSWSIFGGNPARLIKSRFLKPHA